nr:hypothetical protein [Tanacetum cinerariifolium]
MIGSLMYLTASRPDIMFDVCACARHQVTPKECHLHAVKRIFRYLKGHPKLRLWYPKASPFNLVAYSDSNYGGASQDRKSTTGGTEYVATASCCGQVLWIQNQLLDYGLGMSCKALSKEIPISILCLIHTAKTFDLVWIWLGGDLGNEFLLGYNGIQWLSMPCEALSREISTSMLRLLHTAKTFDLVWMWLGGDYGNVFLLGCNGIQCNTIMARLQFCDYHNMIAILEKGEHNVDFHPIVDFVEASPLRYALTFKPTIYVSHIRQFWSTARIETTEEGTKILATVDGILRTVTESSLRRNLKLQYEEGINQDRENIAKTSTLPHDSAPRVTSPVAAEGSMQQSLNELTAFCTSLQRQHSELISKFEAQELEINRLKVRVKLLEDREGLVGERSGDDAPINGRNLDEGE